MERRRYRAGDRVVVRSPEEILSTLDADGTLDGMPFMPEMLDWCGRSLVVERRAEKVCVFVTPPEYGNRRFAGKDVVFLEGTRCDGSAHDGCKRGCKIFWNESWLRPADSLAETERTPTGFDELVGRLRTKTDGGRYFCQSTELYRATQEFMGNKKLWMLRILVRELRNRDRSVGEALTLLGRWSWQRLLRRVGHDEGLRGEQERTPTESLGLEPGDLVRIKRRAEIVATLDRAQSNRGLRVGAKMMRYCEANAEVRDRVDRIIDERTGEMREMRNTVTLKDVRAGNKAFSDDECLCAGELGDCPRGELMFWREIWLERKNDRE
jgi:hypothetical protein